MKKAIGILGGMGPMATCDLMKKIIENTDAACDQEHIRIFVDNNTGIPDRTAAILAGGEDPRPEMLKSAKGLQAMGADVIIIPCNTAHFFWQDVQNAVEIPVLHMLRQTVGLLQVQGVAAAAVLATDGTIQTGLYDRELEKVGITPVHPDPEDQKMIMSVVYDYVKAGKDFPYPERIAAMEKRLAQQGAQCMILGCTELPVAFSRWETSLPTVDPTEILARAAVRFATDI